MISLWSLKGCPAPSSFFPFPLLKECFKPDVRYRPLCFPIRTPLLAFPNTAEIKKKKIQKKDFFFFNRKTGVGVGVESAAS